MTNENLETKLLDVTGPNVKEKVEQMIEDLTAALENR